MPPKKKGKGKGPLKKTQTSEIPEIPHLPISLLERNSMMMMMMMMMIMMMKRVFRMWSLAIHRAYREDCRKVHIMSYGGKLAKTDDPTPFLSL